MPTEIMVLWTIWSALAAVNLVVFGILVATVDSHIYPWPIWLLVPAAALGVATMGTQSIRRQQRRR
jgi:multidrug efflux pump subunit AcrB